MGQKPLVFLCYIMFFMSSIMSDASHAATKLYASRTPVLLIHGINSNRFAWASFIQYVNDKKGYQYGGGYSPAGVHLTMMDYAGIKAKLATTGGSIKVCSPNINLYSIDLAENRNQTFKEQGKIIGEAVKLIKDATGSDKVILVGHSMGGLAARAYVQYYQPDDVAGIVTINTPHLGSYLGNLNRKEYSQNKDFFKTRQDLEKILNMDLSSKAIGYLAIGSSELENLNNRDWPTGLPIVSIVGEVPEWQIKNQGIKLSLSFFMNDPSIMKRLSNYSVKNPMCADKFLKEHTDGIVPVCSQIAQVVPSIAKATFPDKNELIVTKNTMHTEATGRVEVILNAIEKIEKMLGRTLMSSVPDLTRGQSKSIVFILDTSASMNDTIPSEGVRKLDAAKKAFAGLLRDLKRDIGKNEYALVTFTGCNPELRHRFTGDAEQLESSVQAAVADGSTPIAKSMEMAVDHISRSSKNDVNQIILLSDGIETCGGSPESVAARLKKVLDSFINRVKGSEDEERESFLRNLLVRTAFAEDPNTGKKAITLSVIGFSLGKGSQEEAALNRISAAAGGQFYTASNLPELKQALKASTEEEFDIMRYIVKAGNPGPARIASKPFKQKYFYENKYLALVFVLVGLSIIMGLTIILVLQNKRRKELSALKKKSLGKIV